MTDIQNTVFSAFNIKPTGMEVVNSEFVEVDPTGRYGRYNEVLGKGASKTVYRAFDEYEGIEVAWNQVKLNEFVENTEDLKRLYSEINLLRTLNHDNIMKFYNSWVDIEKRKINFITEMFTSGTLRQYRQKHRRVNIRAIKDWCRQILRGLCYLHSLSPPVIHRDLKCDNIFINGNQGEVKIGDLGLAAILRKTYVKHCVGTPEFMAPEVYQEEYNELVDIYSFGMCILEMVTFEYPYSECSHPVQIYKKVVNGKKPDALYKVKDPAVRKFIGKCLATVTIRQSARELLNDPFLQDDDCGASLRSLEYSRRVLPRQPLFPCQNDSVFINGYYNNRSQNVGPRIETNGMELFMYNEDEHPKNMDITIKGKRKKDGEIILSIQIADKEGITRNISFPFDIENDTALSVATEMVMELELTDDYDVTTIAEMIDGEIAFLVPQWQTGPGMDEENHELNLEGSGEHSFERKEQTNQFVFDKNECMIDKNVIVSSYGSKSHGNTVKSSLQLDSPPVTPPSCAAEDDYENEVRQELRWINASYQMELRNLQNGHMRTHSRAPRSPDSNNSIETPIPNSPVSTQSPDETDKLLLQSFVPGKHYSSGFAPIHNISQDTATQRDQHCEASTKSISPERIYTAQSFYAAPVCSSAMHRSTSLLIDTVDV